MEYIEGDREEGCVFCDKAAAGRDRENHILHRGTRAFIILNRYPYSNGHLMVVPYSHVNRLEDLGAAERAELIELIALGVDILKVFKPEGYNVGMNLGRVGGAGIEDHLHFHIVPRWLGDNNFMPIIADTKVIPQYLDETYVKLIAGLESLKGSVGEPR